MTTLSFQITRLLRVIYSQAGFWGAILLWAPNHPNWGEAEQSKKKRPLGRLEESEKR
jgi:hypothetical protein